MLCFMARWICFLTAPSNFCLLLEVETPQLPFGKIRLDTEDLCHSQHQKPDSQDSHQMTWGWKETHKEDSQRLLGNREHYEMCQKVQRVVSSGPTVSALWSQWN